MSAKHQSNIQLSPSAEKEVKALQLELKQVSRGVSILNENQVQKLFNSTNRKWTFMREGKAGQKWKYVKRGYVRRQLDSIFGFNWSFETKTSITDALQVAEKTGSIVIEGRLICVVLDESKREMARLVKDDYGSAVVKFKTEMIGGKKQVKKHAVTGQPELLDFGNDIKAAKSDCFKRCGASLGIAADIYEKDEFFEIEIIGADESSEKTKHTEKLVEQAKDSLKQQSKKVGEENASTETKV